MKKNILFIHHSPSKNTKKLSKLVENIGHNDFGESKFQEAFEKQLILQDLKEINWHFIGRAHV